MGKRNGNGVGNGYQLPFEKPIIRLANHIGELEAAQAQTGRDYSAEIRQLRTQYVALLKKTYERLSPWETVQVARHPAGQIGTEKSALLVQHKGRDTKEKIYHNFGYAQPEGYRKALRVMKLAEKFHLPVVSLIDTPAAYPGVGSEERSVAEAIARNLLEMSRLRTPIVVVVLGEGGSGGALGIGVGDRIAIMEYAFYSVIPPEGCAAILWRTGDKAAEAAEAMKVTARDLKALDVVDEIIPEPLGGAHRDPAEAAANLERHLIGTLRQLKRIPVENLLRHRYERWRRMGKVIHLNSQPEPAKARTP